MTPQILLTSLSGFTGVSAMPAPLRFIRKTDQEVLNRAINSRRTAYIGETEKQPYEDTDVCDPYDSLLEKLMNIDGVDGYRSDLGDTDTQLNEAS
jgi:hypothetical protein